MKRLLITEVFPPQAGGSGRWFWEVYRRLETSNTLILAGSQTGDEGFDRSHNVNVKRTLMSFRSWGVVSLSGLASYRKLAERVTENAADFQPDQLHCGKVLPEGFVAWWLRRKLRIPYLIYVHGEELSVAKSSRELRWMTQLALHSASRVIANSKNTARLLKDDWKVSQNRLCVLHPGVDVDCFFPTERDLKVRQQLGWNDRPVVLTVSRLQKRKGHDQLIRSIPELTQTFPNLLYSIVGDGPERDALKRLAEELGVTKHVDFRGEVIDSEMVTCYQQCDIFALPNRTVAGDFEGFGMVLLEAQACGKPVVAGDSGGTSEAMCNGRTGHVVDCTSVDILANVIRSLLADGERSKMMGQQGRKWTYENFSWNSILQKSVELFEHVR